MKNFNLKRFMQVVRYIFGIHRNSYIKAIMIFFLVFLFFFFIYTLLPENDAVSRLSMLKHCAGIGVITLVFTMFISAGLAFSPLFKKRQSAINYLMLPASRLEKFVASESLAIVCSMVSCVIGFVAADLLQWVFSMIFGKPDAVLASQFFVSGWKAHFDGSADSFTTIVSLLWLISFFMLGGSFFRKVPPLFTFIILIAITLLLGYILSHIYDTKQEIKVVISDAGMIWILAVLTIINVAIAYILFRRMPLVGRKWFNV